MMLGDAARGVLQGAPCPVAVAPKGYRGDGPRTIAVGFDGTNESRVALDVAQRLAADRRAALSVFVVWEDPPTPIAEVAWIESSELREETHTAADRLLEDALTELPPTTAGSVLKGTSGRRAGRRFRRLRSRGRRVTWLGSVQPARSRQHVRPAGPRGDDAGPRRPASRRVTSVRGLLTVAGIAGILSTAPALAVLASACAAPAQAGWSPAVPVPGSASWPAIAVNGSGQVALAWADEAPARGARSRSAPRSAARPPAGSRRTRSSARMTAGSPRFRRPSTALAR